MLSGLCMPLRPRLKINIWMLWKAACIKGQLLWRLRLYHDCLLSSFIVCNEKEAHGPSLHDISCWPGDILMLQLASNSRHRCCSKPYINQLCTVNINQYALEAPLVSDSAQKTPVGFLMLFTASALKMTPNVSIFHAMPMLLPEYHRHALLSWWGRETDITGQEGWAGRKNKTGSQPGSETVW